MTYEKLAAKAVEYDWPHVYSSPDESPEPTGTLDECEQEGQPFWRIWCADGSCRRLEALDQPAA